MTNIFTLYTIDKSYPDCKYVNAISYSKEILENMIPNITSDLLETADFVIEENTLPVYSLKRIDGNIFLTKLYTVSFFNIGNLFAFNKINFSSNSQNVLLDITGFDIDEVRTFNIFKNDLSDNNILFDHYYAEGIMNA